MSYAKLKFLENLQTFLSADFASYKNCDFFSKVLVYISFTFVNSEDHVKNPLGCNNVKKKFENQLISHLKFDDMQDTWLNIEQVNCSEYCFGIMDSVTRSYLFFLV